MDAYRIYGLDARGRILYGEYVDCREDTEAVGAAQALLGKYANAEVWFGPRRVAGPAEVARRGKA